MEYTSVNSDNDSKISEAIDKFRLNEKNIRNSWRCQIKEFTTKKRKNVNYDKTNDVMKWLLSIGVNIDDCHLHSQDNITKFNQLDNDMLTISQSCRVIIPHKSPEGLFVIKNALPFQSQLYWAKTALEKYSSSFHTNLTNLERLKGNQETASREDASDSEEKDTITNIWFDCIRKSEDPKLDIVDFQRFNKLRWASLGYHYNWTHRQYQRDYKSEFPSDLAIYCKMMANFVNEDITAEAAIINYYPEGTCMSGHLDDAELTMEEPIVSISIGCPSIFSIGGRTKDVEPINILLESGDVIVMSRESRYCYHGIPIVLPHFNSVFGNIHNDNHGTEDTNIDIVNKTANESKINSELTNSITLMDIYPEYANTIKYLNQGRINMNVRRVVSPNSNWYDKQGTGAIPITSNQNVKVM